MIDTKLMKIVIKFHSIEYCFHLELKWINVNKLILNMISECLLKIWQQGNYFVSSYETLLFADINAIYLTILVIATSL